MSLKRNVLKWYVQVKRYRFRTPAFTRIITQTLIEAWTNSKEQVSYEAVSFPLKVP